MEAFLNVVKQGTFSRVDDRSIPSEIHTHDVLLGDQIFLEAMGRRYCVHVVDITPETVVLEVEGLIDDHDRSRSTAFLRRYILPRNSSLSLSIPMQDHGPTWTLEWIKQG